MVKVSKDDSGRPPQETGWTYLTNHAHVLIYLTGHPGTTLREAADAVGITERAVLRIVGELEEEGVLTRVRRGRRNDYKIDRSRPLRHPVEAHCIVGQLLDFVLESEAEKRD